MGPAIGLMPDAMRLAKREQNAPDTTPAYAELFSEVGFDKADAGRKPTLGDRADKVVEVLPLLLG